MIVVDTNILAYLLIEGDRTDQAQALFARDPVWRSEAFVLIEFSNVLATYSRRRAVTARAADRLIETAERIIRAPIALPHVVALRTARRFGVSAYDARFLAAAQSLGRQLVTEDASLRAAAPGLTVSLTEAVGDT